MTDQSKIAGANQTGAHVLAAALQRHGVTQVFGQSIPSAFFLAAPHYGIRQVGYRTENAGAAMADAYARISGQVAVVTAQNGPAATLLVPGLAEALKASIPVVAIVQDVARNATDRNAFQELDHFALFSGVAKWVRRVADPARLDDYVDMAFTAAASGRCGPVVLLVPVDVLDARPEFRADAPRRRAQLGTFPLDRVVADPAQVAAAADLLAGASAPLVIAGGGVHASGACDQLAALQEMGFSVILYAVSTLFAAAHASLRVLHNLKATGSTAGDADAMMGYTDFTRVVGLEKYQQLDTQFGGE